ncbi:acyl-CoA desaturase [soil metagenome]
MSKITFNNTRNSFYRSLKLKVHTYFNQNNIKSSGNRKLHIKGIFQVLLALALYIILVFFTPAGWLSILLCALLGFDLALIGFNVMHEGGHQSFSSRKWINKISAYSLNFLGGNSYFWQIKHNINHHTYTNIDGLDFDIEVKHFLRLHENQPKYWFHRFQHLYCIFLYGISYIAWIFYQDFEKYFSKKITKEISTKEHIIFWLTKIFYFCIYLLIPFYMVGLVSTLIGFSIAAFICGLTISVVFQLAHMVEETEFPSPDKITNKIHNEWAIHQVNTTANFATNNKIVSWLLGGLNFQVEHHLFPRVSHVHYPKINQFVKETCLEFNISYHEYPTMSKAFVSHLAHIKKLGNS